MDADLDNCKTAATPYLTAESLIEMEEVSKKIKKREMLSLAECYKKAYNVPTTQAYIEQLDALFE